jgi:hypothetical protein
MRSTGQVEAIGSGPVHGRQFVLDVYRLREGVFVTHKRVQLYIPRFLIRAEILCKVLDDEKPLLRRHPVWSNVSIRNPR